MAARPTRLPVISTAFDPIQPLPSDVSLLTPVGAGEWRGPAGCLSPAVRRLRLSESELWPLRRRSMTPAAGSLDVRRLLSSTGAAARRLQSFPLSSLYIRRLLVLTDDANV